MIRLNYFKARDSGQLAKRGRDGVASKTAWAASVLPLLLVLLGQGAEGASSEFVHPRLADATYMDLRPGPTDPSYLVVNGIADRAFFYAPGKWPTDGDGVTRIPVCWRNPQAVHEKGREAVERAIRMTWQFYSRLDFQNWGTCTIDDLHAVQITVDDKWPATSSAGLDQNGKPPTLTLNFDFAAPSEWTSCKATSEACIQKTAVHEFGHVLGFVHEQVRSDKPDNCLKRQPGEARVSTDATGYTVAGTPWDIDSVMNYCNPVWNNAGHLSSMDILALQRLYGAPPAHR